MVAKGNADNSLIIAIHNRKRAIYLGFTHQLLPLNIVKRYFHKQMIS